MAFAVYPSFFFMVVLLVTTTYFLLGGLPLLILEHDVALDAKFIRRFFEVYYQAAFWAALGATVSFSLWGRWTLALGAGALTVLAVWLRRRMMPAMEQLGAQIEGQATGAISRFRRIHAAALLVNLLQLVALVWGTLLLSRSL